MKKTDFLLLIAVSDPPTSPPIFGSVASLIHTNAASRTSMISTISTVRTAVRTDIMVPEVVLTVCKKPLYCSWLHSVSSQRVHYRG